MRAQKIRAGWQHQRFWAKVIYNFFLSLRLLLIWFPHIISFSWLPFSLGKPPRAIAQQRNSVMSEIISMNSLPLAMHIHSQTHIMRGILHSNSERSSALAHISQCSFFDPSDSLTFINIVFEKSSAERQKWEWVSEIQWYADGVIESLVFEFGTVVHKQ